MDLDVMASPAPSQGERDATEAPTLELLQALTGMRAGIEPNQVLQQVLDSAVRLAGARHGRLSVDAKAGRTYEYEAGTANTAETGSALEVPLVVSGSPVGRLRLTGTARTGGGFSSTDRELVAALAAIGSLSLQREDFMGAIQRSQKWLQAALEVDARLLGGMGRQDSLLLITEHARRVSGADLVGIALPVPRDVSLVVEAASGSGAEVMRGSRLSPASLAGDVVRTGTPEILADARADPRCEMSDDGQAFGPAMVLPLGSGKHASGVLGFFNCPDGPTFQPEELQMAMTFAHQAGFALQLAQAHEDRARLAVLEERDRIAQDLHDVVIQRLFATGLALQRAGGSPSVMPDVLARSIDEIDRSMTELRAVIYPLSRDTQPGVRVRLAEVVRTASASLGFSPRVEIDGPLDTAVPDDMADEMLAVLREALSNVTRHADASRVTLQVAVGPELVLTVHDDGRGIEAPASHAGGLLNLASRARRLGGTCTVEISPVEGTGVCWRVPLAGSPADRP